MNQLRINSFSFRSSEVIVIFVGNFDSVIVELFFASPSISFSLLIEKDGNEMDMKRRSERSLLN